MRGVVQQVERADDVQLRVVVARPARDLGRHTHPARHEERTPQEVGGHDRLLLRERIVLRQHEAERVVDAEGQRVAAVKPPRPDQHGEVERAALNARGEILAVARDELERDGGVLAVEVAQGRGDEREAERLGRADRDAPRQLRGRARDLAHRAVDEREDLVRPLAEDFALRRELHGARAALEQRLPEAGLKLAQLLRERGLADAELLRRARDVPLAGDHCKRPDMPEFHAA